MSRPFFRISAGGRDITAKLDGGNISLTITDGVGMDADTAQIVIDDHNGVIAPPRTGVDLQIIAGYEDDQVDFGTFTVDEVTLDGWPQQISISAQSAKAKSAVKERRPKSYEPPEFPTYGSVFREVASRNGLELSISAEVDGKPLEFEAQAEEHDTEFLTRIGHKLDVAVSIKSSRLIAVKKGAGQSAGGKPLPSILIRRGDNLLNYRVSRQDKPKHQKVKATWFDRNAAARKEVEAASGDEGPDFLIREPFQSEPEARDAANSKAEDLKRGEARASFNIEGNPHARAESHVFVSGVRALVDGVWRAVTVTHNWTSSDGYKTSVECELPK